MRRVVGDRRSRSSAAAVAAVALAWLGWAWYESRLPATYSVMDYAIPDDGGGAPIDEPNGGPPQRRRLGRRPARAAGRAATTLHADRARRARSASRRAAPSRRSRSTAPCPGPELRVREGELVEVTLRNKDVVGRRHDSLARRRPPERRGRRRRRDAGCRAAGRELRLPLPRRSGRDVLVPRAPGIGLGGAARPLRRARDRAGRSASARHRRHRGRRSTRSTGRRS